MPIEDKGALIGTGLSIELGTGLKIPAEAVLEIDPYLPKPESLRSGLSLCLSGGGFRAALFHLGALRRLNELGILSKIDTISSVSGGSILAAHLAERVRDWPLPGKVYPDWESRVAAPFRDFTARNLRTVPILQRFLPWKWFKTSAGVEALAECYERELTRLKIVELPDRPNFIFCATDMAFGVNWTFEKKQVGDYQAGYASTPTNWPLARAVAASSCFPPIFNPLPIGLQPDKFVGGNAKDRPDRDACIAGLRLTDGGNYDNMGLEPVWKTHLFVLVSDGGATFEFEGDKNLLWRLTRYTEILGNQISALRKRWLISSYKSGALRGAYWGIGSATESYNHKSPSVYTAPIGYSKELVRSVISEVRTDLDAFSRAETAVLENHGYLMAEAAIQRHLPTLTQSIPAPLGIPHPQWMKEALVKEALAESHERTLLGRW